MRPDTVTKDAFTLENSATTSPVAIDSIVYEPATNEVTLYTDKDTSQLSGNYSLTTGDTLLTLDGNSAIYNGTLTPYFGLHADEGTISVISMQYEKNGIPLYDLDGETDFLVNIVAVNTTKTKYESIPYIIYSDKDLGENIGSGIAYFDEGGIASFTALVTGRVMTSTDEITIEFTY